MNKIANFLQSRANWCGIALSTLALVLGSMAPMLVGAGVLAVLGYAAGFSPGDVWFGLTESDPALLRQFQGVLDQLWGQLGD